MIRSPAGFDGGDRIKRYLDYYQPSYGVMMLSAGQAFTPASLFAAGEQGAWYDPSDFSTMFQDSAGTTPVTAVEQPVGLLLDKSKGLALGAELVTNGDFSSSTGWTLGTGWTISGGAASYDGTDAPNIIYQAAAVLAAGKSYRVSITVTLTQGALLVRPQFNSTAGQYQINSSGTYSILLSGQGSSFGLVAGSSGGRFIGSVDNISVRELPGNHASQSTAASRPVLSARVNLLTQTDLLISPWAVFNTTRSIVAETPPIGGSSAAKLVVSSTASNEKVLYTASPPTVSAASHIASVYAKAAEMSWIYLRCDNGTATGCYFNLTAGTKGTEDAGVVGTITSVGGGWYRCTATKTLTSGSGYGAVQLASGDGGKVFGGTLNEGVLLAGADLRVTNVGVGLPAYQRVAAATDYDTSGFPLYLRSDGVDDRLIGPSISNLVSASAYEACVGARVLAVSTSNASPWLNQTLLADSLGYVGVGYMTTSNIIGGFNYDVNSDTATQSMTPPSTFVLQQRHDGGNLVLSLNGGSEASAASGNTTSTIGDTRIFSSNGSLSVSANLYGLIIRSTAFTATERANVLTYVNSKTGAY